MDRRRIAPMLVSLLVAGALVAPAAAGCFLGKSFPDFEARDAVTGQPISLGELRGKVVLIDFWATWCGPCVRELPNVRRVYEQYKDRGFEIVSISLDTDVGRFRRFVRGNKMPWHHVMEGGGWKTRLARKYDVHSIPTVFLLDHEGICISDRARGSTLPQLVERAVKKLPAGGAPVAARETPGPGREHLAQLREQVQEARGLVQELARPIADLERKLADARRAIDRLETMLPLPESPEKARNRYRRMRDDLVEVRRDVFRSARARRPVPVPLDLFPQDEPSTSRRAFVIATGQLDVARAAADGLEQALQALSGEIDRVDRDLGQVARRIERNRVGDDDLDRGAEAIRASTELLARRRISWTRLLPAVRALLDELPGDPAGEAGEAAGLRERVTDLGGAVAAAASDRHLAELEPRFNDLLDEVLELRDRQLGAGGP